jgi:hypothetical protein
MNNEKIIPFDWEKYQSGEFEAVCRDGSIPEQITYFSNSINTRKVFAIINGSIESFSQHDGSWNIRESEKDLFLIPKQKKFQAWVNCYDMGTALTWSNEGLAKQYENMNTGFVKTILIEWEG